MCANCCKMRAFRKISRKKLKNAKTIAYHILLFSKKDRNLCAVRLNPKMLFFFGKKWDVGVSLSQFDTSFRKTEKLAKLPVFIGVVESLLSVCDLRCPVIRSRRVRGRISLKRGRSHFGSYNLHSVDLNKTRSKLTHSSYYD